jgi:hypothetical protein
MIEKLVGRPPEIYLPLLEGYCSSDRLNYKPYFYNYLLTEKILGYSPRDRILLF